MRQGACRRVPPLLLMSPTQLNPYTVWLTCHVTTHLSAGKYYLPKCTSHLLDAYPQPSMVSCHCPNAGETPSPLPAITPGDNAAMSLA